VGGIGRRPRRPRRPHVVNGFANGWLVDPGDASTLDVSLDWAPQRSVWGGLLLSTVAGLLCLALVLVGRRRPVLRPWLGQGLQQPQLVPPHEGVGSRPPARTIVVIALAAGLAGAVLVRWWVGPLVALAAVVALLWRWGRVALSGAAVGLMALTGAYVVAKQRKFGFAPDFGWAAFFDAAHLWASIALVLLAVDVVVSWARRRTTVH
jgi:hypothetical protein